MPQEFPKHWRWELAAWMMVASSVLFAAFYFLNDSSSGQWKSLDGVVVRTGMRSDYDGNHPLLIVRLADGKHQQVFVSASQAAECSAGDPIKLMQQGLTYRVTLEGCTWQT